MGYIGKNMPLLYMHRGVNPLMTSKSCERLVPNDVYVDQMAKLVLVNGPNGSGKTTLLRSLALIVILAQIGCYVPASNFAFTPFANIFHYVGGTTSG